jgi:hypothetical protein
VVLSLSWRSCSKRSAVKLSVREPVSSEVFRSTPSFLRQRRFSLELSVWVVLWISAYAGSEAKMRSGHIRFFNDRVHVRLVGVHANTNMLNLFFCTALSERVREMPPFSILRRVPWCPSCALAGNSSAVAVRASGWLSAGTSPTWSASQGSGRSACRSLSRYLQMKILQGDSTGTSARRVDIFSLNMQISLKFASSMGTRTAA